MSIKPQVLDLISLVEKGQMLEAMNRYYAENVAMQENVSPPSVGFAENYAREEAFYGSLQALNFNLVSVVVEGDRAVINWVFDFVDHEGRAFTLDEIAFQLWRGERIVEERFYYDPAQRARRTPQA
jgi:ketosteroid isomerase-like protein